MEVEKSEKLEHVSHKVIEKRRRDRINMCLTELSQTVPTAYAKQSSGKLEKAEILEMTVEYLRAIQGTEIGARIEKEACHSTEIWTDFMYHYQSGYNDCIREILRYMADVEGIHVGDERYVRIISYLQTKSRPDTSITNGIAYRQHDYSRFINDYLPNPYCTNTVNIKHRFPESTRFLPYDVKCQRNCNVLNDTVNHTFMRNTAFSVLPQCVTKPKRH